MNPHLITELNEIATYIIKLWQNRFNDDYVLYVHTHDIPGLPPGVVYGKNFILNDKSAVQHPIIPLNIVLDNISHTTIGYVTKFALFNQEYFYYLKVIVQDNNAICRLGLSSMIYGRSNMHITDIERIDKHNWVLCSNDLRGCKYNGFTGSFEECMSRIIDEEEQLGSPYEDMYHSYRDKLNNDLIADITKNGNITVNNWFGI